MLASESEKTNLEIFRQKLRHYCKLAGYSQKVLAAEVGLHPVTLSNKLNLVAHYELTYNEIKRIITVLAEWGGIVKQSEVVELLELAGLTTNAYTDEEWKTAPLVDLEIDQPKTSLIINQFRPAPISRPDPATFSLPLYPSPIVGRKQELTDCAALLHRSEVRLLTLTGPGGVGKTRLGLELSHSLREDFKDGACFVTLATAQDGLGFTRALLKSLDLQESKDKTKDAVASNLTIIKDYLQEKHLLLVLDNFEQIISARLLVADLLSVAPALKIITTSQILLQIYGEHEFVVPPLSLPELENNLPAEVLLEKVTHSEAINLFLQRAKAAKSDFTLNLNNASAVVEICRLLDGLPLALELAAARIKLLSPAALLKRLSDRLNVLTGGAQDLPERHQSLRRTLEWSYDLLDKNEKQLFYRLAVFVGDFALQAAEEVLEDSHSHPDAIEVMDGLNSLLNKSLLQRVTSPEDETRYRMLETIREYATELLGQSGEQNHWREQHAIYYTELAEEVNVQLNGAEQRYWLDYLEREYTNMRAALEWLGEKDTGLRLIRALEKFWHWRGRINEGRQYTQNCVNRLTTPTGVQNTNLQAKVYLTAARFANIQHEYEIATEYSKKAARLNEALGDKTIQAELYISLGELALYSDNYRLAHISYENSLALYKELGDIVGQATSLQMLGALSETEDAESSKDYIEASIALWRKMGNKVNLCRSLNTYSVILSRRGNLEAAQQALEEAIAIAQEMENPYYLQILYTNLVVRFIKQGQYEPALPIAEEARKITARTGNKLNMSYILHHFGTLYMCMGDYPLAQSYFEKALEIRQAISHKRTLAYCQNSLGVVASLQGNYAEAANYLQQALATGLELKDSTATSGAYLGLGRLEYLQGNYEQAWLYLLDAFRITLMPQFKWSLVNCLAWLAIVAAKLDRPEQAVRFGITAQTISKKFNGTILPDAVEQLEKTLAEIRGQLDSAVFETLQEQGQNREPEEIEEELFTI